MWVDIGILLTGASACWLSQDKRPNYRKWACVFGIVGQPLWFWTAYINEQWGVFLVSFIYTISWVRGIQNNWIENGNNR